MVSSRATAASAAPLPCPRPAAPPLASPTARSRRRPNARALQRRNRRVEAHRDLVRPLALHYARCSGECGEDLIQVGLLGLIRAAELYQPATTTPFDAFARPHIRGAILHYLRDLAPRVRLPRRQAERLEQLQRLERSVAAEPGRLTRELERAGLDPDQCLLLLRHRRLCRALPLDAERLAEIPAEPETLPEPEETPPRAEALLAALPAELALVVRRIVLEGLSYRRLASELGVSPMTVQRRLQRGLEALRQAIATGAIATGAIACGPMAGALGA